MGNFGEFNVIRVSRARLSQFIAAMAVLIGALTLTSGSAQAASLNGAFSNITVTAASGSGLIYPWEQIRVTADWSVPDKTAAGTTFSLAWPAAQLNGIGGSLALKNTTGATVANCTLGATSLDCSLTSFVTSHPYNIKGSVWFTLTQVTIPENTTVTIPFTSGTTKVSVKYPTTGSVPNTFTGIDYYKDVWVHDGTVTWYIYLPGGKTGQTQDYNRVVVEDTLGGNQTFLPSTFSLEHATKLNSAGTWPIWQTAAKALYTVTPTGSNAFTFNAKVLAKGGWWRIVYDVKVSSGYTGQISNTAKTSWDKHQQISTAHTEVYLDAGGTGSGENRAVSVGDTVWWDKNHDGIQNDGPGTGIGGAMLTLTGPDGKPVTDVLGNTVAPITTGATGVYLFQNLPPLPTGEHYTVTVTPPTGYQPTVGNVGTDRVIDSSTGSVTSGDVAADDAQDLTLDFGLVKGVTVGDYVWFDTNSNGIQDSSESGIPGVTLTLTGPGGEAVTDLSGHPVVPTTTDSSGKYMFSDLPVLPAGQHYRVTVTPPAGYVATTPNVGADRAVDSSTGSSVSTDPVTDASKDLTLDFGFVQGAVSVGDFVWEDTNRNGIQDSGEPGMPDVTVTLQSAEGAVVATTQTDANGYYAFPGLTPGQNYSVVFTPPSGAALTTQNAGSMAAVDSDPAGNGKVVFTAPSSGVNLTASKSADLSTIDAGYVKLNLTLTKSVTSSGPYFGGSNATYKLVPHNDGPVDALAGWSVTEVLPAGSTLVGLSGDGYTCYTNLVCISSTTLVAGADGNPITVVVRIPADLTGQFKNVAYVSPAETEATETDPLVVPTIGTDTVSSLTDNDAEAVIGVLPPEPEGIVITLPNTGTTIPLTWLLGAIGIVAAGVILLGAARFNGRGRKH